MPGALQKLRGRLLDEMHSWARTTAATRGLDNDPVSGPAQHLHWPPLHKQQHDADYGAADASPALQLTVAEAFLTTPVILAKYIDSLVSTLEHVQRTGKAPEPAGVRTLANGQHVIKVSGVPHSGRAVSRWRI